ncbi:hypothetical protein THAOC_09963, partial [Thalassiosira oceanica]
MVDDFGGGFTTDQAHDWYGRGLGKHAEHSDASQLRMVHPAVQSEEFVRQQQPQTTARKIALINANQRL